MNISVEGYKGLNRHQNLNYKDLTIFIGKNGTGKSTTLDVIKSFLNSIDFQLSSIEELSDLSFKNLYKQSRDKRPIILKIDVLLHFYGKLSLEIILNKNISGDFRMIKLSLFNTYYSRILPDTYKSNTPLIVVKPNSFNVDLENLIKLHNFRHAMYEVMSDPKHSFILNQLIDNSFDIEDQYHVMQQKQIKILRKEFGDSYSISQIEDLVEDLYPEFYIDNLKSAAAIHAKYSSSKFYPKLDFTELEYEKIGRIKPLTKIINIDLKLQVLESNIGEDRDTVAYVNQLKKHQAFKFKSIKEMIFEDASSTLKSLTLKFSGRLDFGYKRSLSEKRDIPFSEYVRLKHHKIIWQSDTIPEDERDELNLHFLDYFYVTSSNLFESIHVPIIDLVYKFINHFDKAVTESINKLSSIIFISSNLDLVHRYINTITPQTDFEKLISEWNKKINIKDSVESSFDLEYINKWLQTFEIADSVEIENFDGNIFIYLIKGTRKTNLVDEGSGIIMIMKLLIALDLANKKGSEIYTLVFEEPETNLYPALQSKLADLFADALESLNSKLIIETHSEYFIRKLQYLILKEKVHPARVALNYFEMLEVDEGTSEVKVSNYTFDEQGKIDLEFKEKFMDESHKLKLELYNIQKSREN